MDSHHTVCSALIRRAGPFALQNGGVRRCVRRKYQSYVPSPAVLITYAVSAGVNRTSWSLPSTGTVIESRKITIPGLTSCTFDSDGNASSPFFQVKLGGEPRLLSRYVVISAQATRS